MSPAPLGPRLATAAMLLALATPAPSSPDIQHWRGAGGSRVFFVEARELPMVDVQLLFDAGSARDPAGKKGLAVLVNSLLDEGAGELDATALSFEFERLGAIYSAAAGADFASVSLRALSDETLLGPALRNLRRVVAAPTFPAGAVERQKQRMQLAIERKGQAPAELARDAFMAAIYAGHPYAFPNAGALEDVASLTERDVAGFYRRLYVAGNAMVVIVGDLTRTQARALADELTNALAPGGKPSPLPPVAALAAPARISVKHPSSQTHILLGQPGVKRGDPDYFPLYLGNHVLGSGTMVSRLHEEAREKRGLAYSAYSYFSPRRERGPFIAGLQTRADQQEQALRVMRETIEAFIATGPTAEELRAAKKNLSGGFPLRLDSNRKILEYVAMIGFYGLPLDYLDTFVAKIDAVSLAQIKDAFARRLRPDRFVTVTVGPAPAGEGAD